MTKDWDKIATMEFEGMDPAEREDWADLRARVTA